MADSEAPLYLIAGGRTKARARGPDPLLHAVLQGAGTPRPSVAYVGAASGDNAAFRLMIARILQHAGAGSVTLAPLCGRRGDAARAAAVIESSDLVFISGGDVEAGMAVLQEQGIIALLKRLHRRGKPFFGISAGSIMLARAWVRWTDPDDDDSAEVFPCLGFAPVLCDTHGEGDGWGELKALLGLRPVGSVAYGIVSGSALVAGPGGSVAALGGEVHVFRKRKSGVVQAESLRPAAR